MDGAYRAAQAELILSDDERAALEGWVRRSSTPQAWALRCRIILAGADGISNEEVAARLGSTQHAVGAGDLAFSSTVSPVSGTCPDRVGHDR